MNKYKFFTIFLEMEYLFEPHFKKLKKKIQAIVSPLYLSYLHTNSSQVLETNRDWLDLLTNDDLRCQGNKVDVEGLGDEREGARDPKVTLNNLQLIIFSY